ESFPLQIARRRRRTEPRISVPFTVLLRCEGPVRPLTPESLVVRRDTIDEVDELGDREPAGAGTATELDVLDELLGKGAQHAANHHLLLDREEAAVRVGDLIEPVPDPTKVIVAASTGFEPLEASGYLAGPDLAGRALPAGLDRQET